MGSEPRATFPRRHPSRTPGSGLAWPRAVSSPPATSRHRIRRKRRDDATGGRRPRPQPRGRPGYDDGRRGATPATAAPKPAWVCSRVVLGQLDTITDERSATRCRMGQAEQSKGMAIDSGLAGVS